MRKEILGDTRQYILILMWSAVFVLLLACANVANLQLARAMGQQRELAVRVALGASRSRIVSQVLVESSILSAAGGVVGLVLAAWAVPVTRAAVPPFIVQHIAGIKNIRVDGGVLAFTAVIAVLAGILAGVLPALQACFTSRLGESLKEGTRGSSSVPVRRLSRSLLVLTEVALAMILLVGACVMVKGFRHLANRYPGYEASGALSFRVTLPEKNYVTAQARADFYERVVAKLEALPGVQGAAGVQHLPSGWSWQTGTFSIEDMPARPGEQLRAGMQTATPGFFRALRIPLRSGRFLSDQDGLDTAPVAVITETMARRYWSDRFPSATASVLLRAIPGELLLEWSATYVKTHLTIASGRPCMLPFRRRHPNLRVSSSGPRSMRCLWQPLPAGRFGPWIGTCPRMTFARWSNSIRTTLAACSTRRI